MPYHSNSVSLESLFAKYLVQIPAYQRSFAWKKPLIDKLLSDALDAFQVGPSSSEYFIGTIIVVPADKAQPHVLDLVDGQQRLTVLVLAAGIIASMVGTPAAMAKFHDVFLDEGGVPPVTRFANTSNRENKSFFSEFIKDPTKILASGPASGVWLPAYDGMKLVHDWVFTHHAAASIAFLKFLLRRLEFIAISADGYASAVVLFERLNGGEPLAVADLLKNFFIKNCEPTLTKEEVCRTWDLIEQHRKPRPGSAVAVIGGRDEIDGHIQKACSTYIWKSVIPKAQIFDHIGKSASKTPPDVSAAKYLQEIERFTFACAKLRADSPTYPDGKTGPALVRLMTFPQAPDWVDKLVLAIPDTTSLAVRERLCEYFEMAALMVAFERDSKNKNAEVQPIVEELRFCTDLKTAIAIGKKLLSAPFTRIDATDFKRHILSLDVRNKNRGDTNLARYLLQILEDWVSEELGEKTQSKSTVEHVVAQKYLVVPGYDDVCRIGNLCLLGSKLNSKTKAAPYSVKKSSYAHSKRALAVLLDAGVTGLPAALVAGLSKAEFRALWDRSKPAEFEIGDVPARSSAIAEWLTARLKSLQ